MTDEFVVREASAADLPGIGHVRTSVIENLLTAAQLASLGITPASVATSLLTHRKGWVAEQAGEIVAFSMADRADASIFALFVLPQYEGRGLGSRLFDLALNWLWDNGAEMAWLTTAPQTRAARFYAHRGWLPVGVEPNGDLRFEYRRPCGSSATSRLAPVGGIEIEHISALDFSLCLGCKPLQGIFRPRIGE